MGMGMDMGHETPCIWIHFTTFKKKDPYCCWHRHPILSHMILLLLIFQLINKGKRSCVFVLYSLLRAIEAP